MVRFKLFRPVTLHFTLIQQTGTPFDYSDPETYWTQSAQFLTWWKNNIERKAKFQGLIRDADSSKPGILTNKSKRSFYCRIAVALANNIRNHFSKHVNDNAGLVQVTVPSLENTHPSLEPLLIPLNSGAPRKVKLKKSNSLNGSESGAMAELEGLDLLSHTISSQQVPPQESKSKSDSGNSELDESDVLGMGGLLSLRAYNPEAAAVTFCENIYNRSIPGKEGKRGKGKIGGKPREDEEVSPLVGGNPFKDYGFSLVQKNASSPVTIMGVQSGSAAHTFGFRNGDIITHVDGRTVEGKPLDEIVNMLLTDAQRGEIDVPEEMVARSNGEQVHNSVVVAISSTTGAQDHLSFDESSAREGDHNEYNSQREEILAPPKSGTPPFLRLGWLKRRVYEKSQEERSESEGAAGEKRAREGDVNDEPERMFDVIEEREADGDVGQAELGDGEDEEELIETLVKKQKTSSSSRAQSITVTTLGCSRAFITCVLSHALQHVKRTRPQGSVSFPFHASDITRWLQLAAEDCLHNVEYQMALGGTPFDARDPSTYWTNTHQFITWWKNNVERKSKFSSLKKDAASCLPGDVSPRAKRALYCRIAVALSQNIRNHFDRIMGENEGVVVQLPIPTLSDTHPEPLVNEVPVRYNHPPREEMNSSEETINIHLSGDAQGIFVEDTFSKDQDETFKEVMYSLSDDAGIGVGRSYS